MADELDDIFGAIDGEEGEEMPEQSEQAPKAENDGDPSKKEDDSPGEEKKDVESKDTAMVDSSVDTKQLYNSIMYAPTTSHLREQKNPAELLSSSAEALAEKQKKTRNSGCYQ